MSTNDLPTDPERRVPELGERRRRRQLEELLQRRDRLGASVMQRMCHGLPDDTDALAELVGTEASIAHCWPEVYDRDNGDWLVRDAAALHDPSSATDPSCIYCQAAEEPEDGSTSNAA